MCADDFNLLVKICDGDSCLAPLAEWIAEDAATKSWGRPVDRLDMSEAGVEGRVVLPHDARDGDRLTVVVAPGSRVWVDVVAREGHVAHGTSRLTSRLAERVLHDVAMVRAAWSIATSGAPVRLPGELPGRHNDPFASKLVAADSRCLFDWAVANGANGRELAGPWRTKDALWTARLRLGLPFSLPGAWLVFDEAVAALIDDDEPALSAALADLGCCVRPPATRGRRPARPAAGATRRASLLRQTRRSRGGSARRRGRRRPLPRGRRD